VIGTSKGDLGLLEKKFFFSKSMESKEEQNTEQEESGKEGMDVIDETRRKDTMGNMEKIEKEFAALKEKFFGDKLEGLDKELEQIENGTHQAFLRKLEELEELKKSKIWQAEEARKCQLLNIENVFSADLKQADDEFISDKNNLKKSMMAITEDKQNKLASEKNTLNLTIPERITRSTAQRESKRKRSTLSKDQSNGKRRLNPSHINYSLRDNEIMEDLKLIQKASSNQPSLYGKASSRVPAALVAKE